MNEHSHRSLRAPRAAPPVSFLPLSAPVYDCLFLSTENLEPFTHVTLFSLSFTLESRVSSPRPSLSEGLLREREGWDYKRKWQFRWENGNSDGSDSVSSAPLDARKFVYAASHFARLKKKKARHRAPKNILPEAASRFPPSQVPRRPTVRGKGRRWMPADVILKETRRVGQHTEIIFGPWPTIPRRVPTRLSWCLRRPAGTIFATVRSRALCSLSSSCKVWVNIGTVTCTTA